MRKSADSILSEISGSLQSSEDTNGLKKTRHEHKSSSVALLDGGRSLSSVENVPSFISDSNMTVIYTYSGATAHIDCGVNMLGKISNSQYPYISDSNVLF